MVRPLKFFGGTHSVRRHVLGSWLLAAICSVSQLIVMVQIEERHWSPDLSQYKVTYKCTGAGYTTALQRKISFTFQALSFYAIPASIMVYCYACITRVIWLRAGAQRAVDIDLPRIHFVTSRTLQSASDQSEEPVRSSSPSRSRNSQHCVVSVPRRMILNTKLNVIKMSITVTVGFLACFTPFFVVSLIRIYSDYRYTLTGILAASKLAVIGHSALNPVLYLIFSTRAVRATFVQLCQSRCCRPRRLDHGPAAFDGQQRPNQSPQPRNARGRVMNLIDRSRRSGDSERAQVRNRGQQCALEVRQLEGHSRQGCYELGNRATWDAAVALHYSRHSATVTCGAARSPTMSSYWTN